MPKQFSLNRAASKKQIPISFLRRFFALVIFALLVVLSGARAEGPDGQKADNGGLKFSDLVFEEQSLTSQQLQTWLEKHTVVGPWTLRNVTLDGHPVSGIGTYNTQTKQFKFASLCLEKQETASTKLGEFLQRLNLSPYIAATLSNVTIDGKPPVTGTATVTSDGKLSIQGASAEKPPTLADREFTQSRPEARKEPLRNATEKIEFDERKNKEGKQHRNPSVGILKVRFADSSQVSQGSCFPIRPGTIATCLHVISGAVHAEVTFSSGLQLPITGIVAEDSANDLALVTINHNNSEPPPLPLASEAAQPGAEIIACGYPKETYQEAHGRVEILGANLGFERVILSNAKVTHAFSGGPALNERGEVVGVLEAWVGGVINEGKEIIPEEAVIIPSDVLASLKTGPPIPIAQWTASRPSIVRAAWEVRLGELDTERDDYTNALAHFQKAAQLVTSDPAIWSHVGGCLQQMEKPDEAIVALEKSLALNPRQPETHATLAQVYLTKKRYPEAIQECEKGLHINPNSERVRYLLAIIEIAIGETNKARKDIELIRQYPAAAEYLNEYYQKSTAKAAAANEASRQRSAEIFKRVSQMNKLAEVLNSRDGFAQAMDVAQGALKTYPQSAEGHKQLGIAFAGLGRLQEALESFSRALAIAPEDGETKKIAEDLAKRITGIP